MTWKTLYLLAIGMLLSGQINGQTSGQRNPDRFFDEGWITISGTVTSVDDDLFTIDYGPATVGVDLREWELNRTEIPIADGDSVVVSGIMDDDLLERRSLKARSLYVPDLNAHYFVSQQKEIDRQPGFPNPYGSFGANFADEPRVVIIGTVQQINGREFTLKAGRREVQIDTSYMKYNPLDKQGSQQISKGDHVSIGGELDQNFFEEQEILADTIVSLNQDPRRR